MRSKVQLWCLYLKQCSCTVARASELLSRDERARLVLCRNPSIRDRLIVARAALRLLLAAATGCGPRDIAYRLGPSGKPYLASHTRLHFSLSHSEHLAVYALGNSPLGLDIEYVRPVPYFAEVASQLFGAEEWEQIVGLPDVDRELAFFTRWVRREAEVKARGGTLETARVAAPESALAADHVASDAIIQSFETERLTIEEFSPATGYCGALAHRSSARGLEMHWLDGGQLFGAVGQTFPRALSCLPTLPLGLGWRA